MSSRKLSIPFFTDNDIPDSVGEYLKESGHSVTRLREVMLTTAPDPIVATACREAGLVLVTHNVKDFRHIVKEHEVTKREVDRLCRIEMGCVQVRATERIAAALEIIESEWTRLGADKHGLRIFVGDDVIRIHR